MKKKNNVNIFLFTYIQVAFLTTLDPPFFAVKLLKLGFFF